MVPALAPAQNAKHPYRGQGYFVFGLGTGFGSGFGSGFDLGHHPLVKQVAFGGEVFLYKGLGFGGEAEYANWSTAGGYGSGGVGVWIGSVDASYHFRRRAARGALDPFVLGGFSLYGPTSSGGGRGEAGGNFGGGVNLWLAEHAALRLEVRDHVHGDNFLPGDVAVSAISFRIGVTFR